VDDFSEKLYLPIEVTRVLTYLSLEKNLPRMQDMSSAIVWRQPPGQQSSPLNPLDTQSLFKRKERTRK
jgi:hypothetical protein